MAGIRSLLSAFVIFSALSAISAYSYAWSYHHTDAQPNICERCCGYGRGDVSLCAATECRCPPVTPKPVPICEDCCSPNPTNPKCLYTKCHCPPITTTTTARPLCETCCSDKASTESRCRIVRCACELFNPTTTTTARPASDCRLCCSPAGKKNVKCKGTQCHCPRIPSPPTQILAPCVYCCSGAGADNERCRNNKCNCPGSKHPTATTTTAKPTGICGICCEPGADDARCNGVSCSCPARIEP